MINSRLSLTKRKTEKTAYHRDQRHLGQNHECSFTSFGEFIAPRRTEKRHCKNDRIERASKA